MCYSVDTSVIAFTVGISSSLLLYFFGNDFKINSIIAYVFLFASLMQLVDFFIWIDLDCKKGLNRFAGNIGFLLNAFQPVILFLVSKKLYNTDKQWSSLLNIANVIYVAYVLYVYYIYLKNYDVCSNVTLDGRKAWKWYEIWDKYRVQYLYMGLLILNSLPVLKYKYLGISGLIVMIFFILSYFKFNNHLGTFWCALVNSTPLIILIMQKVIGNKM
jgi:hypothetical protein